MYVHRRDLDAHDGAPDRSLIFSGLVSSKDAYQVIAPSATLSSGRRKAAPLFATHRPPLYRHLGVFELSTVNRGSSVVLYRCVANAQAGRESMASTAHGLSSAHVRYVQAVGATLWWRPVVSVRPIPERDSYRY